MTATYCLAPFAKRLRDVPPTVEVWRALLAEQPEVCPKGCTTNCRTHCGDWARVQWRAMQGRRK